MDSPRESAILTAVNFLRNPKVSRSSLLQKRNFLASKGLSDDEIQSAFERVGIFTKINMIDTPLEESTVINVPSQSQPPAKYKHQMTTFEKIKDLISSAALLSGIAYAVFMFYKRYIEPFFFGRKKKGDKLDELAKTTKAINGELIRVREEINTQKQAQESANKLMQNSLQTFKSEIETIKGILLNHRNFSSKPSMSMSSSAINIPKIPSWQLATKSKNSDDKNDDDKHSNSSENDTEVITEEPQKSSNRSPANSDSSLEIM